MDGTAPALAHVVDRRHWSVLSSECVLVKMWTRVRKLRDHFDVVLNCAYDALPFRLAPFFDTPVAHLVSMGSQTEQMDAVVKQAPSGTRPLATW